MIQTIRGLEIMARLPVAFLSSACAVYCLQISNASFAWQDACWLFASVFFMVAGGFIFNDYCDVEKDRLNEPERPLPAGMLTLYTARNASVALFTISALCSLPLARPVCILALINICLLGLYARILSMHGFLGNLVTAYMTASLVLMGALQGGQLLAYLPLAVFLFVLIVSREIVFDLEHLPGDRTVGLRTVPMLLGDRGTFFLVWGILSLLIVFVFVSSGLGWIENPIRWAFCSSLALGLMAWGLYGYQATRRRADFRKFAYLGRLGFALFFPGIAPFLMVN